MLLAGISGSTVADEGHPYTLQLGGAPAASEWTIDWGDGSVEAIPGNPSSVSHVFADGPSRFPIRATALVDGSPQAASVTTPYRVDHGFAQNGTSTFHVGPSSSSNTFGSMVQQPDGKIVVAGWRWNEQPIVARFLPDGRLDASFGTGGLVDGIAGTTLRAVHGVAVGPAGEILLAGIHRSTAIAPEDFAVVRLHPNGTLDSSFGTGGSVVLDHSGAADVAGDVAVLNDGSVVVAGAVQTPAGQAFAVLKLDSTGLPDSSFGEAGWGVYTFPNNLPAAGVNRMRVDPAGRLVVGGYSWTPWFNPFLDDSRATLVRFNADGSVDDSFGNVGAHLIPFGYNPSRVTDVTFAADGALIIGGYLPVFNPGSTSEHESAYVARVLDGDTAPGAQPGWVRLIDFNGAFERIFGVAVLPDGAILASGDYRPTRNHLPSQMALRLNPDGTLDESFGQAGRLHLHSQSSTGHAILIDADNAVTFGGGWNGDLVLTRYQFGDLLVTVRDVSPTLTLSGPASVLEGEVYELGIAASDPGDDTILEYRIDWGDGTTSIVPGTASSATHLFPPTQATRTIQVVAVDENGVHPPATRQVFIDARPFVQSAGFLVHDGQRRPPGQSIVVLISESVGTSLTAGDLHLVNLTTGQTIGTAAIPFTLSGGRSAKWSVQTPLPDGDYRATLPAGAYTDLTGNTASSDYVFEFFVLAGDANRDRAVDLLDFNIFAANFGQSNRTFSQGDFNYDGVVNLQDFNILASRFGIVLGASAPSGRPQSLFRDSHIGVREQAEDLLALA